MALLALGVILLLKKILVVQYWVHQLSIAPLELFLYAYRHGQKGVQIKKVMNAPRIRGLRHIVFHAIEQF